MVRDFILVEFFKERFGNLKDLFPKAFSVNDICMFYAAHSVIPLEEIERKFKSMDPLSFWQLVNEYMGYAIEILKKEAEEEEAACLEAIGDPSEDRTRRRPYGTITTPILKDEEEKEEEDIYARRPNKGYRRTPGLRRDRSKISPTELVTLQESTPVDPSVYWAVHTGDCEIALWIHKDHPFMKNFKARKDHYKVRILRLSGVRYLMEKGIYVALNDLSVCRGALFQERHMIK